MIRIDAMWLAVAPVDMRAGPDRLLARVVEVFGSAQAHHGYLFANTCATRRLNQGGFSWPEANTAALPALTPAQFDALVVGLPWQRLSHMQRITHV
jgi:hypothetical protein